MSPNGSGSRLDVLSDHPDTFCLLALDFAIHRPVCRIRQLCL
jgi:hypothetical protein